VDVPPADQLAERLRAQPRTARLAEAFAEVPGSHLVGGAVRDLLLDDEPVDLDVVVEGDGPAAARAAAEALGGGVREHGRFGTATVVTAELSFDVVSARAESYAHPGALPEVRPGSLDEDLARRDFTVNAIALALHAPELGRLTAFEGALDDLAQRTLRVMHAASFRDDPTRLLRLVRYGARLDFEPDARTDALARDAVAAGAPATVSGARLGAELRLLVAERTAPAALTRAHALGLDHALHAAFDPRLELVEPALSVLPPDGRADLVLLAACCTRFDRAELREWLDRLEVPAGERETVIAAALDAPVLAERLEHAHRPSELRHLAAGRPVEEVAMAAALGPAEPVRRWFDDVRPVELEITGDDVVAAGVPEGPAVGQALEAAWRAALDDGVKGREGQLAAALAAAKGS
jgi:tRNA nucleotidyltransferase (CCA-adding enzyme)